MLDVRSAPGLSDLLIGALSLSEATQSIDLDPPSFDGSEGRVLDVVVAGALSPPNPGELIESDAMEALLERARSAYDLVVIDTPPLAGISDAFALLRKVDGVIIVGRVGRSRRDVAERLHETLASAGAPLLGVVANGLKGRLGGYGYGYSYDYAAGGARAGSRPRRRGRPRTAPRLRTALRGPRSLCPRARLEASPVLAAAKDRAQG